MTARATDPTSSHERVERIDTDTDHIDGKEVRVAIGLAFRRKRTQHEQGLAHVAWINDDDITNAFNGHFLRDVDRGEIARHRLRWETDGDGHGAAVLVRVGLVERSPGGRRVLHFRAPHDGEMVPAKTLDPAVTRDPDSGEPVDERYPEHAKLKARRHDSELLSELLDWMDTSGWHYGVYQRTGSDEMREVSTDYQRSRLIGRFLGIDHERLETEKRDMLAAIREANGL